MNLIRSTIVALILIFTVIYVTYLYNSIVRAADMYKKLNKTVDGIE